MQTHHKVISKSEAPEEEGREEEETDGKLLRICLFYFINVLLFLYISKIQQLTCKKC